MAETFALFFAIVLLGGAASLLLALTRQPSRQAVANSGLALVAMIAVGATLGSLYFSEVAGFFPCELCWYQRIAMYPLAVVGSLALLRRDQSVMPYALILSTAGLAISIYHIQLQLFPEQGSFCDATSPCTVSPVKAMGWMTIPQMAAVSFALITVIAILSIRQHGQEI